MAKKILKKCIECGIQTTNKNSLCKECNQESLLKNSNQITFIGGFIYSFLTPFIIISMITTYCNGNYILFSLISILFIISWRSKLYFDY